MRSKFSVTFYGAIEADAIWDSTQSFTDVAGVGGIARPAAPTTAAPNPPAPYAVAAGHHRWTESIRNSRIGFRIAAPEFEGLRTSALVEVDWLGNAPPTFQQGAGGVTEAGFWNNAGMRVRHVYLKMESNYVDVLFGQTWNLFGWQTNFHPLTVEIQGVPGQLFGRTAQLRLSHLFKSDAVNVEAAAAAVRPPERDAALPDGQGGLRLIINNWKGVHTAGGVGGRAVDGLSVGVSGLVRQFKVAELFGQHLDTNSRAGWGISVDGMLPIVPATPTNMGNALTLNGSFQTGSGFNDQYTGLTGGSVTTAAFAPNNDNGLVTYDAAGKLHTINWNSFLVGLQYYLPPSGNFFLSANFSQMKSDNIGSFGAAPAAVFNKVQWYDFNLFWNVTPALRFGAEYAFLKETYVDGIAAHNHRGQFSGYFVF